MSHKCICVTCKFVVTLTVTSVIVTLCLVVDTGGGSETDTPLPSPVTEESPQYFSSKEFHNQLAKSVLMCMCAGEGDCVCVCVCVCVCGVCVCVRAYVCVCVHLIQQIYQILRGSDFFFSFKFTAEHPSLKLFDQNCYCWM